MKTYLINSILILLSTCLFLSCASSHSGSHAFKNKQDTIQFNSYESGQPVQIEISMGKSFNHPTFVIWIENIEGKLIETLYITKSYASGEFGHAQLSDSTWSDNPGQSYQPAALPYWNHKKGILKGLTLVPTPAAPYVDAYTSATPTNNVLIKGEISPDALPFRLFLEVNQTWDWNKYWTNGKYPNNPYYRNSAQPSLIYSVLVSKIQKGRTYHLNPIGHGHPSGDNGELFTDLSTLTTAKNIFESITLKF